MKQKYEPLFAISVRQPWAWLLASGHKDIENRNWATQFRGRILIHAGKQPDEDYRVLINLNPVVNGVKAPSAELQFGGIIGELDIVDCVSSHSSKWFCGKFGFVCKNARPLPFVALKGQLGIFQAPGYLFGSAGASPSPLLKKG